MTFGFRKVKLTTQLSIIIFLPALLTIAFLVFNFFQEKSEFSHPTLIGILVVVTGYCVLAGLYIKRLSTSIISVKQSIVNLLEGRHTEMIAVIAADEFEQTIKVVNAVHDDLKQKTIFVGKIKEGKLETSYKPIHESDLLGHSLIGMKDYLTNVNQDDQKRKWASDSLARFVEALRSNDNIKKLSNELIILLVKILGANQGALFLLQKDENGTDFLEMQSSYALDRIEKFSKRVEMGEGILGQMLLEKQTVYLKNVPEKFIQITSGLGAAQPKTVLIVPLKVNDVMVGIAELASFKEFEAHEISFVEQIGESMAHTITSFRIAENTKKLLNESQAQAEQMRAQEEELRQNQEELQATQEEISRKYNELFKQLTELNYQSRFDQLRSITLTRKRNIEYYFDIIRNQILTFSENRMVVDAVKEFKTAFYQIDSGIPERELLAMRKNLESYYRNEFIPRLRENTDAQEKPEQYLPENTLARVLQYRYISNNPHPTGQKALLDNANDGSEYSRVHEKHHPIIRSFLEKFGYYDIFFIDNKTGDILYSVFKEIDYATSLLSGLYSNTNFGKVVRAAIESHEKEFVRLIDFEPYDPSYRTPASFIACPIYDGEEKIGILVFQMPINKINQILTGDNNWMEDGLGYSGETFMVGHDYMLRSIARELVESPDAYIASLQREGLDTSVLHQIRKTNTSILLEKVEFDSVTKALNGQQGTQIECNASGEEMLNAYAPLNIPDVKWVIVSSIKEKEVSERINNLRSGGEM
jgi:GAF domain-containing protein